MAQDEMLGQISLTRRSETFLSITSLLRSVSSQASTVITGKRLGKNVISDTTDMIQKYSDVFDRLMQNFWDRISYDVAIHIHDIGTHVHRTEEILDLGGVTYAEGAGLDTRVPLHQVT